MNTGEQKVAILIITKVDTFNPLMKLSTVASLTLSAYQLDCQLVTVATLIDKRQRRKSAAGSRD